MSNRLSAIRWLIAGTFAGGILGSVGIAVAQTGESTTTTAPASSSTAPSVPAPTDGTRKPTQRTGETPLTGADADKARAAALAAVPGATIGRATTGAGGGAYDVHLTRPDGTHATVKLDSNLNVLRVEEGRPGGKGCHRGGRGGPRAEVTGEAAGKAEAAALAAVPGATAHRVMEGKDGGYVVLLTKADGGRAAVRLDESFTVTSVEDKIGRPGRRPHRNGPPPAAADGTAGENGSATPTNV